MKMINKYGTRYHVSIPRRPNKNPTEVTIREIKKRWYRIILKNKVPKIIWDYGLIWICEMVNLSVSSSQYESGKNLWIILLERPLISASTYISCFIIGSPAVQIPALVNFQSVDGWVYLVRLVR